MAALTGEFGALRALAFHRLRRRVRRGLEGWGVHVVVLVFVTSCTGTPDEREQPASAQPESKEVQLVEFEDPRCGPDVVFFCAGSVLVDCSDGQRTDCQDTGASCVPEMGCLRSCDPDFL